MNSNNNLDYLTWELETTDDDYDTYDIDDDLDPIIFPLDDDEDELDDFDE